MVGATTPPPITLQNISISGPGHWNFVDVIFMHAAATFHMFSCYMFLSCYADLRDFITRLVRYTAYLSKSATVEKNVPKSSNDCRFKHWECFCDFRITIVSELAHLWTRHARERPYAGVDVLRRSRLCLLDASKYTRASPQIQDKMSFRCHCEQENSDGEKIPSILADCLKEQVSITLTKYIVTPFREFSAGDVSVQNLQVSTSIFS